MALRTPHNLCARAGPVIRSGRESQPESQCHGHAVASESPVLAVAIALQARAAGPDDAPRLEPGATRTRPSVSRRNGCSSVTLASRVAPRLDSPVHERGRARRRPPPATSPLRQHVPRSRPRERAARRSSTASSANASSARAHRRQGGVADAPPRHGRLRPGRWLRARSPTRNCPTMADLDPATNDRAVSVSGAPRQRSGVARSCRERGSAFRLARKSGSARSVAAVTLKGPERSGGPAELAEQVDGRE